ncbi:MAG: hypothetical protein KF849_12355 [Rhizobiaceae bacterium]|nr:hypothetical protein [Rhizobiaceae bacterium]
MTKSASRTAVGILCAIAALAPAAALAHAADRGFVMLLPTGHYMVGGALAVLASFTALALIPPEPLDRLARWSARLLRLPVDGRVLTSTLSLVVLMLLIWCGLKGSRDPLSNPLPLVIWTVWWVGLTLLVGLFGNLWRWLDPWYGPARAVLAFAGRRHAPPLAVLPRRIGAAPAILVFLAFAWFELIHPAPDDPELLAVVVAAYWLFGFVGVLVFGHEAFTRQVECFSVFFAMISKLAMLRRGDDGALHFNLPGAKALDAASLGLSGTLFLLLALSTVSFDGLMRTFLWLGAIGVNPLEFPGRTVLIWPNTLGMMLAFATLAGAFLGCVWIGQRLAGRRGTLLETGAAAGALVWSIAPIALAYHFSHYLVSFVLYGQYALAAISDPLSNGANLFGTAGYHVLAGATTGAESAWVVWNLQAGAIIAAHVLAVLMAHVVAFRLHGDARRATVSQIPLALLMIGYTVLGLWLLSSPTGF